MNLQCYKGEVGCDGDVLGCDGDMIGGVGLESAAAPPPRGGAWGSGSVEGRYAGLLPRPGHCPPHLVPSTDPQPPPTPPRPAPPPPTRAQVKGVVEAPAEEHEEEGLRAFNNLEKHLSA